MKKCISYFVLIIFCYQIGFGQLQFEPKFPTPGDKITMIYTLDESPLASSDQIDFLLYSFEGEEPIVHEVAYQRSDNKLHATFTTNANTKLISVAIKDANDAKILDNHEGKGFQKLMCKGEKPVKGALYQKAMLKNNYSRIVGIDRDQEKAASLIAREIDAYGPLENKQNKTYLNILARADQEKAKSIATSLIAKLNTQKKLLDTDLADLKSYYDIIDDQEKSEKIAAKIKKKYPHSAFVQAELINAFFDTKDMEERTKLFAAINPENVPDNYSNTMDYMAGNLANHYAIENDWVRFEHYISKINDKNSLARTYNSLAWKLSGESTDKPAINAAKGMKYSKKSIKLLEGYMADLKNKPAYRTEKEWMKSMRYSSSQYADTYALLAYQLGNYEEALASQHKACELMDFEDAEKNETYAIFYEKVKGPKATGELLEGMIKTGHSTTSMKEQFKTIFIEHYSKEDAYRKYMAELEKESNRKLKEELIKELLDLESPEFSLVNLDGQQVSMQQLRGKVVVVDFWATWCGPCKASFPGMQKAVDKYRHDTEVEFLFIDTWEREEEKEKNARDFITENEYSFNVLMDNDNKVVASFKVEGIPTKFVIGKDQKIRFKSVGFSGSDEKLVNELSIMIEYLKELDGKKMKVSMK